MDVFRAFADHLSELADLAGAFRIFGIRSEEHTSELQSHSDIVCRLLLEKKKNTVLITLPSATTSNKKQMFKAKSTCTTTAQFSQMRLMNRVWPTSQSYAAIRIQVCDTA